LAQRHELQQRQAEMGAGGTDDSAFAELNTEVAQHRAELEMELHSLFMVHSSVREKIEMMEKDHFAALQEVTKEARIYVDATHEHDRGAG
jgi:hypothetical protein